MFLVSFHGFWKARYFPFGESCSPEISGLPKINSRSISGGKPPGEAFSSLEIGRASWRKIGDWSSGVCSSDLSFSFRGEQSRRAERLIHTLHIDVSCVFPRLLEGQILSIRGKLLT